MEEPPFIRKIFAAAIEIDSEKERAKYLTKACGGDEALKAEIEGLVEDHFQLGPLTEDASEEGLGATVSVSGKENVSGATVGPYKLLQQIGEGGMGSVWMAEQEKPVRRMVALKIIKAGMDSKQVIARFEAERQALALMNHPNIAKVLDAGTTEKGRPYFVMELVKGVPITEFCDKNKYSPKQRLKLFIDVCRAVQHAHQKGVIHRDIKPSNVMVTLHDGVPVVKVIDFGLAKATSQKLTERTLFTAYGQMVGTPSYMSPEQAEMSGLDVDTRTDVYSLGVLLYELMTGTTPIDAKSFRKAGFAEIQRMIQQQEAPPMSMRLSSLGGSSTVIAGQRGSDPKRLSQLFRGDLDVVVLKSVEKDRSRRYSTPSDFADDVQRFLSNEAIEARPASVAYRLKKVYQRNRAAVLTALSVACILVFATIFSGLQAIHASIAATNLEAEQMKTLAALDKAEAAEAEQRRLRKQAQAATHREKQLRLVAERSERRANWNTYVARLLPMEQAWKSENFGHLESLLSESHPEGDEPDFRGWEWYFLQDQISQTYKQLSTDELAQAPVDCSPVSNEIATRHAKKLAIWNTDSCVCLLKLDSTDQIVEIAWSRTGNLVATGTANGRIEIFDRNAGTKQFSIAPLSSEGNDKSAISSLSWSPEDKKLAFGSESGFVGFVEIATKKVNVIRSPSATWNSCGSLDWHPSKPWLVAGFRLGRRVRFDLSDGSETEFSRMSLELGSACAWSGSGKLLAVSDDKEIRILDPQMQLQTSLVGHNGTVDAMFWVDERLLVSGSSDHSIRVWDVVDGLCVKVFKYSDSPITHVARLPDGDRFAFANSKGRVYLTTLRLPRAARISTIDTAGTEKDRPPVEEVDLSANARVQRIAWSKSGKRVAATGVTGVYDTANTKSYEWGFASIWDGRKQTSIVNYGAHRTRGVKHADQEDVFRLATNTGQVVSYYSLLDHLALRQKIQLTSPQPLAFDWSNSGSLLVVCNGESIEVSPSSRLDASTSLIIPSVKANSVKWSGSGNRIAAGGTVLDKTGEIVAKKQMGRAKAIAWHPSDRLLFFGRDGGDILVADANDLEEIARIEAHQGTVNGIDVSPCGRRIASASDDGTVRIFDVATGRQLLGLSADGITEFYSVAWSPDGLQLASGTGNGKLVVWGSESMKVPSQSGTCFDGGSVTSPLTQLGVDFAELLNFEVKRAGWKRYHCILQRANDRESFDVAFAEIKETLQRSDDPHVETVSAISAMIYCMDQLSDSRNVQHLCQRTLKFIHEKVNENPESEEYWQFLAEASIVCKRTASSGGEDLTRQAKSAFEQVLQLNPENMHVKEHLEFLKASRN